MGLTLYGMDKMMRGELLDEFAGALKKWRIQQELERLEECDCLFDMRSFHYENSNPTMTSSNKHLK